MKCSIQKMRCIVVLIIANLLPLAMTAYEDLGYLCLKGHSDEQYRSVQANISYSAIPYPLVTKDNNITLTCTGRSVRADFVTSPSDESYMTHVEFYKNNGLFYRCREEEFRYLRRLSCNVTVTGVTNDDKYMCVVRASNAPCNAAQLSLQIEDRVAPDVSSLIPTLKCDGRKTEITCVGTGIPEPKVAWLLNGSMINHTNTEKTINVEIETNLADVQNGTNVYRVNSKIVITGRTFPLRIQCVVMNETHKVYSENVYALYVEVMVVQLSTATVRWRVYPQMNNSFVGTIGYNVSLKCGKECFEETRVYNETSVTFSHLTMGRAYTVKIQALSKIGDLAIGAVEFYSPDKLPKPTSIFLKKITSQKAVIGWRNISADTTAYGVLLGYKFVLIGKNRKLNVTLTNNENEVLVPYLTRKSEYAVGVRGFTQYSDGRILEYNFTTLDVIPAPLNVKVKNIMENSAVVQWTVIEQEQEKYDVLTGYKITVKNETRVFDIKTSSHRSSVSINHLGPDGNYTVSVVGLSEETEGMPSEWISFQTSDIQQVEKSDEGQKGGSNSNSTNSNLTIVTLPIAIILGAIIVLIVLALLRIRARKMKKKNNIKPNEIVMEDATRSFGNNLRMLYPEYYDDEVSNGSEDLPAWEISRARLAVLDNILGGGYFGLVKEGVLLQSVSVEQEDEKVSVAVKTLRANRGQNDWNELLREYEILQFVNSTSHPNIIKLIGGCTQTVPILLVMEFCSGGNLKDLLRSSRVNEESCVQYNNIYSKLTERQLINFAAEVARGMKYLFEKKIVHRDIASRNILLNDQHVPKISDFGLARKIDSTAHYIVNKNRMLPVKWMSIESLAEGRFTLASDIWSYGVLLWEICTLAEEPYPDVSPYDMLDYLHEGNRMNRPEHCSIEIFSVMRRCWQQDPEERLSFNDIYNSLENMLTNNERKYINLRPYHDVNETRMSGGYDLQEFPRRELSEVQEGSSQDSGVFDTFF